MKITDKYRIDWIEKNASVLIALDKHRKHGVQHSYDFRCLQAASSVPLRWRLDQAIKRGQTFAAFRDRAEAKARKK